MTTLSGPVGMRNFTSPVANAKPDQQKVIDLLWRIDPIKGGGQKGLPGKPSPETPLQITSRLVVAIGAFQTFWHAKGEFKSIDGVVDRGGATLKKLDLLAAGGSSEPNQPVLDPIKLNVIQYNQMLPNAQPSSVTFPAASPASVGRYAVTRNAEKEQPLEGGRAQANGTELLFRVVKNETIFWVGAYVPEYITDYTKAYIFFHPDTMSSDDDKQYPRFAGRWSGGDKPVKRYVPYFGIQAAAALKCPVIVPFMTAASRANTSKTNLFADRGIETINDILTAMQISVRAPFSVASIQRLGVASYSSGVNHMDRLARSIGGSGFIREQMDFDSAFMIQKHSTMPVLSGAQNWMASQVPAAGRTFARWVYFPPTKFGKVGQAGEDVHTKLGYYMYQGMLSLSVLR